MAHIFITGSSDGLGKMAAGLLINKPQRMIYVSSGLHRDGDSSLEDILWEKRPWNGYQAYADSKLHNVLLAFAIADKWKDVHPDAKNRDVQELFLQRCAQISGISLPEQSTI
jgi:hypothetical protein